MLGDKLSPGTKPGFLKSEKMLGFKQHLPQLMAITPAIEQMNLNGQ